MKPACEKCGDSNWAVGERPFMRNFCASCDHAPVATMPGPQTEFVGSKAAHPAYLGGRGAAKTVAGVIKTFLYVTTHPGANGAISLPTYADVKKSLLPVFEEFFGPQKGTSGSSRTRPIRSSSRLWGRQSSSSQQRNRTPLAG